MMKNFFCLVFFLSATFILKAQNLNFDWAHKAGGTGFDDGWSLAKFGESIFVAGRFENVATFGMQTLTSAGDYDGFVASYFEDGSLNWVKSIGGSGAEYCRAITTDLVGNIYVCGNFSGTMNIEGTSLTADDGWDVFVISFAKNGAYRCSYKAGGIGDQWPTSIASDHSGKVALTGVFYNNFNSSINLISKGSADVFILSLDSSGNYVHSDSFGGLGYDVGNSIIFNNDQEILVAGSFEKTFYAQQDSLLSFGLSDGFLLKLDAQGNLLWQKNIGGTSADVVYGLSVFGDHLYVCGIFKETIEVNGINYTSLGGYDAFLTKLSGGGDYIWMQTFGGMQEDRLNAITTDLSGNVFVGGSFSSSIGIGSNSLNSNGNWDFFIIACDSLGGIIGSLGGGGASYDVCKSLVADFSGLYTTGYFGGTAQFGSSSLNSSAFSYDAFIARINYPVSLVQKKDSKDFSFWPNPSTTGGQLSIFSPIPFSEVNLVQIDGKRMHLATFNGIGRELVISLPLLSSGIYFIEITSNNQILREKMIIY